MVTGLEAGGMVAGTEIDAYFLSGIVDAYPIGRFVTQILSAQNDAGDPVVHGLGGRLEVDMLGTGEQQGWGGQDGAARDDGGALPLRTTPPGGSATWTAGT